MKIKARIPTWSGSAGQSGPPANQVVPRAPWKRRDHWLAPTGGMPPETRHGVPGAVQVGGKADEPFAEPT